MQQHKNTIRGFTLIEVMIAVAIVGILAAVAFPSYMEHVRKGSRLEAQNLLLETAARQQRYFSNNNYQYAADMATLGLNANTDSNNYVVSVAQPTGAQSFTLTATAQGTQANDPCGNLTLTHSQIRGVSGSASVSDCWR